MTSSFGEDADHLCAPFDLAVETLNSGWSSALGPMLRREGHIGEHAVSASLRRPKLGQLGRSWSATRRHWAFAASASSWAKAVAMKADTPRRPLLPSIIFFSTVTAAFRLSAFSAQTCQRRAAILSYK